MLTSYNYIHKSSLLTFPFMSKQAYCQKANCYANFFLGDAAFERAQKPSNGRRFG